MVKGKRPGYALVAWSDDDDALGLVAALPKESLDEFVARIEDEGVEVLGVIMKRSLSVWDPEPFQKLRKEVAFTHLVADEDLLRGDLEESAGITIKSPAETFHFYPSQMVYDTAQPEDNITITFDDGSTATVKGTD